MLLSGSNDADSRPASVSLGDELRRAAREAPDLPFLRMMNGEWTFAEIDRDSDRVAAALHAEGVRHGDVVSLMLPNCAEFVVAWLALAKLGAVTAPLNTAFRGRVLADAAALAGARILVAHGDLRDAWSAVRSELPALSRTVVVGGAASSSGEITWEALCEQGEILPSPPPTTVAFSDLCLLLYTSGTTGRSKAAMIPHRFVLGHAALTIEGLGLRADDVLYCPYPLYHLDATVMTVAPALLLRSVAAIGERFSVSRYWDEVRALDATVFDFMGATLTMLWKQPPSPRDRDHRARLGWGVPLPEWADQFEARFGCRLVELYGATEIGVPIFTPLDRPRRKGACGRLLGPFEARLADADGNAVSIGTPGELLIRPTAPSMVTVGYYRMPEATLEAFRDLWFHTGDLLRQDSDGYFYFVGRNRDVVRRRGENISAAEVEMAIEAHPVVLECAVIGVASDMTEEDVMAVVVLRPGETLAPQTLLAWCEARLARFMLPRYVRFVPALARTPTDKVEKFRLRDEGITADTFDRERQRSRP
ncbi:MAG: AMP-binding protein [Hyphomicrobiaceae bacterium]